MSGHDDADESHRRHQAPYTSHHPIPTISRYKELKEARRAEAGREERTAEADGAREAPSTAQRAKESWRAHWADDEKEDIHSGPGKDQPRYSKDTQAHSGADPAINVDVDGDGDVDQDDQYEAEAVVDTSEVIDQSKKKRRKGLSKKEERAEREVTDPITHLPVRIYDFTGDSLKDVDENPLPWGRTLRTATGLSNKNKDQDSIEAETRELQDGLDSMRALFPPPSFDAIRQDLMAINKQGVTIGLMAVAAVLLSLVALERVVRPQVARVIGHQDDQGYLLGICLWIVLLLIGAAAIWFVIQGVRDWMTNRFDDTWQDQVWEANLQSRERQAKAHETESVIWLNSLIGAVWPLVNPDLFTSLADTLEDVMQASLPALVRMVSVEDLGQGSESLRILGVRWLPTGAAARSVGADGRLGPKEKGSDESRGAPEGNLEMSQKDASDQDSKGEHNGDDGGDGNNANADGTEKTPVDGGMEAEEGDFINLEVAFAYRARKSKSFAERTKDLHMYLAFYLPGNVKVPVWVDFKGIVGLCRLRLQLTPDPPFFALCTMSMMGQPKVDISCIPLVKYAPNIMDLPLISNFVQNSVDAAIAEYVAPQSITLDLKDMLAGDDFKKDTAARGVVVVDIIRGYDFKAGDAAIPLISDGSSDPYVSVGWAKFGKPLFSTRVLISEMEPCWHERAVLLVTPTELNVDERVRLQLWDSDRFTADDDLGRIEVDLKHIMKFSETNGNMCERKDGFRALKVGENMPGKLEWRVGYFSKTRLQPCQFQKQNYDPKIRNMKDLEQQVQADCERKLREAQIKQGRHSRDADELEQQKAQEMKTKEDALTISAPPPDDYPSGVFSIQIHQITGLELEKLNKSEVEHKQNQDDEEESGSDLPSAYCNIIINHKKVFKTRTKPKNAKPFYNAATERFIGDWRHAEVFVAVRDSRIDEDDPLLGIVHLPLQDIFKERAQVNGFYPLVGGLGYGRVRISMVWRSVQLRAPRELLGWDCGTLEIQPAVSSHDLPAEFQNLDIKCHSNLSSGKFHAEHHSQGQWRTRKDRPLRLAVHKRYASNLAIRFKQHRMMKDKTAAFAILWLKDIPDEEEKKLTLPVYTGDFARARACCLDQPGEQVGTIDITVTFWSGLGAAHSKWIKKDPDLRNVQEVLETARDNQERYETEKKAGILDGDGDEAEHRDDDSSSDEEDSSDEESGKDAAADGESANIGDRVKEIERNAKQKHRKNRGVMQYKLPRTLHWAANRGERLTSKVEGIFTRHPRAPGIETEV